MKKSIILRIFFGILIIATMVLIFLFSSENGSKSTNTSKGTVRAVVAKFEKDETKVEKKVEAIEPASRKVANFTVYTFLGIWTMSFCSTFSNLSFKKKIVIVVIFGFLYACSDELHQLFVSKRSASLRDVFLDTLGATNGALIVEIIIQCYKNITNITKPLQILQNH